MTKIDFARLKRDIEERLRSRPADVGPDGRRATGAMALVREHLTKLEAMRASGATWVDIAAGLAMQGVVQRDGQPITGRRLTALMASVRREEKRKAQAAERRAARIDLRREEPKRTRLTLSADLVDAEAPAQQRPSDEERRRARLEQARGLLKKG